MLVLLDIFVPMVLILSPVHLVLTITRVVSPTSHSVTHVLWEGIVMALVY